jgi:hypothetical protein
MNDTMPEGVVEANFVRREYYIEPPAKGASVEAWAEWQKADRQAAINAKRAFTKAQAHAEIPEYLQPKAMVKIGGVYRQSALVGLVGDGDSTRLEAAIDADQDTKVHLRPWDQVGGRGERSAKRSGSSKRAKAKALRRARKGQN